MKRKIITILSSLTLTDSAFKFPMGRLRETAFADPPDDGQYIRVYRGTYGM